MSHVIPLFFFSFFAQYGTTPLIWAARKGHYESVMHLLANGADVDQEGAVSRLQSPVNAPDQFNALVYIIRNDVIFQNIYHS